MTDQTIEITLKSDSANGWTVGNYCSENKFTVQIAKFERNNEKSREFDPPASRGKY